MRQTTLFGFVASPPSKARSRRRPAGEPARSPSPAYWGTKPKRRAGNGRAPSTDSDSDGSLQRTQLPPKPLDDDEVSPRRPTLKRRRLQRRRASSPSADDDEDDEGAAGTLQRSESPPVRTQRVRGATSKRKISSESEGEQDTAPPPRKRKLLRARPTTPDEEDDDLDEDQIIDARLRARGKQSAYMRGLEKLKRKRDRSSPAPESGDEDAPDIIDVDAPFAGAKPSGSFDEDADDDDDDDDAVGAGVEDEDEDTFIVDDGDDAGVPVELPVAFNMATHQDMGHHFKIICQMFVHALVAEDRENFMLDALNNQYFSVPLQATRRKLQGIRDSLIASSVWKAPFRRPLEKLPDYETVMLEFSVPGCDACSLGGRLSSRSGRLSGRPYDPSTYTSLHEEDDDEAAYTRPRMFELGRFCATRASVFHRFSHWEYKLFHALADEVKALRRGAQRGFVAVRAEGARRPPTDLDDADGIVDWLDSRQVIQDEYKKIKNMIVQAHNLDSAVKKGEDDLDE